MDPNANLDEQLKITKRVLFLADSSASADRAEVEGLCVRLAELVEALDHWITGGGFLPSRWTEAQKGAR